MSRLEEVTLTNICMIYDKKGNILVQQRKKSTWPGLTFPGGHVEKNESFVESVIREVKEETGLTISNVQLCGLTQWTPFMGGRYITFMFKTSTYEGTLQPSDEGEIFWIKKEDLSKYELSPDLKEMFDVMDSDSLNEFYSLRESTDKEILRKLL